MKKLFPAALALSLCMSAALPAIAADAPPPVTAATDSSAKPAHDFKDTRKSDSEARFRERQKMEEEMFKKRQAIKEKYHSQYQKLHDQERAELDALKAEVKSHYGRNTAGGTATK